MGENEFELLLREEKGGWTVELGGRGEERMIRMISFLCEFLLIIDNMPF